VDFSLDNPYNMIDHKISAQNVLADSNGFSRYDFS
jgi:hypothetical protein